MSLLTGIAKAIKGHSCERLIRQTKNEINIEGVGFGIPEFKVELGRFSNKIVQLHEVKETMVTLDYTQYLLCTTMHQEITDDKLKDTCNRIRLQIIIGFNQLEFLLSSAARNPSEEMNQEIAEWIRFMGKINRSSMEAVAPIEDKVKQIVTDKIESVNENPKNTGERILGLFHRYTSSDDEESIDKKVSDDETQVWEPAPSEDDEES